MPLKSFICPDNVTILVSTCLKEGGCRMGTRCATRSYLQLVSKERPWTGKPSTTQLIQGTMQAFLKLTREYSISPDKRAFMIHGTKGHENLEMAEDEHSELEKVFDGDSTPETGISDVIETENGRTILADYKTSGSYKVAKALGFATEDELIPGEYFKTGPRAGQQKTRKVLKRSPEKEDRWEWELQLNKYRIEAEKRGRRIDDLRIQCIVRDGNTHVARGRGVFRNVYYFSINILPDAEVLEYFRLKREALYTALKQGYWTEPCTAKENWDGLKCKSYCEVAEFCSYGRYLKEERVVEEMAIKGLSDIRRLPRLGKIRLGVMKTTADGKEYPSEVDYFILDPQTPSETENKKLIEDFERLYGKNPKQIKVMFPVSNKDVYFPQFYKRYGKATALQCKGDGEIAYCATEEFARGLKKLPKSSEDLATGIKVECRGRECPYYTGTKDMKPSCTENAALQVLLPDLPGAGVWQVTTGSFHSIVNVNSCIDYIIGVCGRAHMIPLLLERRAQETANEGKKRTHYIMHINMNFALSDLQRYAMIDPKQILLELPTVESDKEDILFQQNEIIDVAPGPEKKKAPAATKSKEDPEKEPSAPVFPEPEKDPLPVDPILEKATPPSDPIDTEQIMTIEGLLKDLHSNEESLNKNIGKLYKKSKKEALTYDEAHDLIKRLKIIMERNGGGK